MVSVFTGYPSDTVQLLLLVVVIIFAIAGNVSVCCLLLRFKALRTIPNILVLDLSIVDCLNATINASLFAAYFVVELNVLHGRALSVMTEIFYRSFLFLNLTTKLLMMLDRYFIIIHGIRYTLWKSRSKVCLFICTKWVFCLAVGIGSSRPLWKIDLGDAQVLDYRSEYLETNGKMVKRLAILINHGLYACLAVATFISIRKTDKELKANTRKTTQADLVQVNNSSKVKASKTIVLLVFCDFVFYLPMVMYLYMAQAPGFQKHGWFPFCAHYFSFISSVNNPIIYYSRTQRFRMALLKMLRDPCGSDDIFEIRTLPVVKLVHQKRVFGHVTNAASSKRLGKPHRKQTRTRFQMESNATVNEGAALQLECDFGVERQRKSDDQSSAPTDDFPLAFVHRSTSNDDGSGSKQLHQEVNVILSNRRSGRKEKCSAKELKDGKKPGANKNESSTSTYSSRDKTQETSLSPSEDSQDSYDTWL